VHFSGAELFRRVWGRYGRVDISSGAYSDYWTTFALHWGFRLFLDLLICCGDLLPKELENKENSEKIVSLVEPFLRVPIITAEELKGWSEA
jgi:hypothetical protein